MQKILLPLIVLLSSLLISSCSETYVEELESLEGSYFNKVYMQNIDPILEEGKRNVVYEIVFDMTKTSVREIEQYIHLDKNSLNVADYIEKVELVNVEGTVNDFFPDDLDFNGEDVSIEFSPIVTHFKPKRFSKYQLIVTTRTEFPEEIDAYCFTHSDLYQYENGYWNGIGHQIENELKNIQFVKK